MSDSQTSPLLELAKTCSIASAASFGLSALVNAMIFWIAWRINYFVIAGPTDVVMGGFAVFVQFAEVFIGISLFVWATERGMEEIVSRFTSYRWSWVSSTSERNDRFSVIAFASVMFTSGVSLWGIKGGHSLWWLLSHRVERPAVYRTGLRVASESHIDRQCLGGDVLWMGGNSAVLACA